MDDQEKICKNCFSKSPDVIILSLLIQNRVLKYYIWDKIADKWVYHAIKSP